MEQLIYTKESLIEMLHNISERGWILNTRGKNHGAPGNLLEDLLGIPENNLPIPNAAEWELKAQRSITNSLTTLFHCEPSPRAIKFVPELLLKSYGWRHKQAGKKYPDNEMSFRQTICGLGHSNRGFTVDFDEVNRKVIISFNSAEISSVHSDWRKSVEKRIGLNELNPQPYWGFDDLEFIAGTKLPNCFYVQADVKKIKGEEFFHYNNVTMLRRFSFSNFLNEIKKGNILVDFDARTGHNHGTKFRMRQKCLPNLYEEVIKIF